MPPPTRELIERLTASASILGWEARDALTALQAENDRLRAQASPAWVAIKDRKPTKEDADDSGNVLWYIQPLGFCSVAAWDADPERDIDYWQRLPAAPESAADRQRREDEEYASEASEKWRTSPETVYSLVLAALAHARKEATP